MYAVQFDPLHVVLSSGNHCLLCCPTKVSDAVASSGELLLLHELESPICIVDPLFYNGYMDMRNPFGESESRKILCIKTCYCSDLSPNESSHSSLFQIW